MNNFSKFASALRGVIVVSTVAAITSWTAVAEAQTITAVYTTYSATGVPTKLDITGTAFCTSTSTTSCGTKPPVVKLGGNTVAISGSSPTGIGVPLTGVFADGDYLLSVTPSGKTAITYAFTLKSKTGGTAGPQGPAGPIGPAGPQGSAGLQGPKGDTGAVGANGAQGPIGLQGPAGTTGPQGPLGLQGPKGDEGSFPSATATGAVLYWTGVAWAEVAPPRAPNSTAPLRYCYGNPMWVNVCPPPPPGPPIAAGTLVQDCSDCPVMVSIAGGSFAMGGGDSAFRTEELPVHDVTVPAFLMGQTEVTQGEWLAVIGTNPSYFTLCGFDCPVENISWDDAQAFVTALSNKTGKIYRLPTEAEWEYATRAGSSDAWTFGNDESTLADYGWRIANSNSTMHPVRGKLPNGFGLYDVHGGVWEWVLDRWHPNYEGAPVDGSEWSSGGDASQHIVRGASWGSYPVELRSAYRDHVVSSTRNQFSGLRVVRAL